MPAEKYESYFQQREKELGYKPQNEVVYNQNLPYSHVLDNESTYALSVIKTNLSKVVLQGELRVGLTYWASQLTRYIRLYGLKFSLQDHKLFIKLLYEAVVIPDLECLLVERLCNVLGKLLKKRELLSYKDLELDWVPLYNLVERLSHSKMEPMGLEWLPSTLDNKLKSLVRNCRQFFPSDCTQSMLDTWKPLFCPFDIVMGKAVKYFDLFLPTLMYNEDQRQKSWKLWLDEFLSLWKSVHNGPSWEKHLITLFARVAHNNIGHIDWSDYIGTIFSRVLRAFNLPVGKLQHTSALASQLPIESSCLLIVSMMGGPVTKIILQNLKCLLETTETFFYPSNLGKWSVNLVQFIQAITAKFVNRIFRERYKIRRWEPNIPFSHMIEDADIEEFVTIIKPVALFTLYSKLGSMTASKVLQNLAYLRPDLILPILLNKTYVALNTLTEPHQVRACLTALSSTINPALVGYPEIRLHIMPLLFQCLPALDPNDLPKSTVAFQFISTCLTLIPLVDCSGAPQHHPNLSETDKEVCLMTAQFEDFAIQFFDRCFILLEGMNQGTDVHSQRSISNTDLVVTQSEGMSGLILVSAATMMLQQMSGKIFKECLKKLFLFATTHLFEGHVAMSTAATLCAVTAKADPVSAFEKFIPFYSREVLAFFDDNPEAKKFEKLDKQFLWDIKMLSEICHVGTKHSLKYKDMLFNVAKHTIDMFAKEGYEGGVRIIKFCIRGWSLIYTHDRRNVSHSIDQDSSNYLAIKDWGATMTPWKVNISWHVPSEEELEAAFEALDMFLEPALQKLIGFSEGSVTLDKDELQKTVYIVKELLRDCTSLLPAETNNLVDLDDETFQSLKSWPVQTLETLPFYEKVLSKNNRKSLRLKIFNVIRGSLQKIMSSREDDVDSVCSIIDIYSHCFLMHEQLKSEFDQQWKVFAAYKATMKNPFQVKKKRDRFTHIDRSVLQQRMRVLAIERSTYTSMHHDIMIDLISLSTSHYMKVRGNAQALFFHGLSLVPHVAYKKYLPLILKNLDKENPVEHQKFKGSLYLLIGQAKTRVFLACYQKWDSFTKVWPALINAPPSDKPSIAKLYEKLALKIQNNFASIAINYQLSNGVIQAALNLVKSTSLPAVVEFNTEESIRNGQEVIKRTSMRNKTFYSQLVNSLIDLYQSGDLTWKHSELSLGMLSLMLRYDIEIPERLCSLFVSLLIDDTISVRTLAIGCVGSILKQQKRKHLVEMKPVSEVIGQLPDITNPGDREDNAWIQYDSADKPDTKEKFETTMFIDKTHWGYYCWPNALKTYLAFEKQPKLDRIKDELSASEKPIFECFTDKAFINQLIFYLSLENEKEKDKFDDKRMDMFRGLFRNFGDTFVPLFKHHIERLVQEKQESSQRCAAEIITGMVMGSKHWDFDKVSRLWSWLLPALRTALTNISVETLKDWDSCFSHMVQNRDPRRIHWLMEFLVNEPVTPSSSVLIESSKLYVLQGGIHQQEWRVPQLLNNILNYIEPRLGHPYKNIRNRYGSLLASLFLYDVCLMGKPQSVLRAPSVDDFLERITPRLEPLMSEEASAISSLSTEASLSNVSKISSSAELLNEINILPSGSVAEESDTPFSADTVDHIRKTLLKMLPPGASLSDASNLSNIKVSSLKTTKIHKTAAVKLENSVRTLMDDALHSEVKALNK